MYINSLLLYSSLAGNAYCYVQDSGNDSVSEGVEVGGHPEDSESNPHDSGGRGFGGIIVGSVQVCCAYARIIPRMREVSVQIAGFFFGKSCLRPHVLCCAVLSFFLLV